MWISDSIIFFFFNDTATTEIYTLSLHDALPIFTRHRGRRKFISGTWATLPGAGNNSRARDCRPSRDSRPTGDWPPDRPAARRGDRKSTRLNSSHANISYAVFCLKKKKKLTQALF